MHTEGIAQITYLVLHWPNQSVVKRFMSFVSGCGKRGRTFVRLGAIIVNGNMFSN